ncbi:hypothetical protein C4544_04930 [candidate division WS5 bacterium]|uniref:Uncharacterized protein n=1 Tax=candidate division WS5 bacterium TaxID=2093353 RepID=A0A419DBJ1_9BACT|nr:MAG: hypothetical protein C4544_04930 [candidate division WS5 bacterium]
MTKEELQELAKDIVKHACELKDKHTDQKDAPVHYCCIFSQSDDEYGDLLSAANKIGKVIEETPTGPLFQIELIETVSGSLQILKIRTPDPTRPERGDADFAAKNYEEFKEKYLSEPGFNMIERDTLEMIEIMDSAFNVRAYFSNPPVEVQYDLLM